MTRKTVLRKRKSKFIDIFRTTPAKTVCPNFYVLAHANGCTFSPRCSYCYLMSSFWHTQEEHAFVNVDQILREAKAWIGRDNLESYVLNTGNLSDSLVFENVRPLVAQLVELFREEAERRGRRHTLLLVTKGGVRECRPLFEIRPCRNVVISFSVNASAAARQYEGGAGRVADRLLAARRLQARGWRVRIRIDPMIAGFDYSRVIAKVKALAPERVTLGALRAEPNLARFTEKGIFSALEAPQDPKGLARYPRAQRLALYRQATEALSGICPIGLCEETLDIWRDLRLNPEAKSCNCGS